MSNNISSLFITLSIVTLSFFVISCSVEPPKSNLVLKNNLLYKSDSKIPFTGHEKAKVNENIIEYDVKDGYKHGEFKLYDLNGNLQMQGQFDSNRNVGKWQYFYGDGRIESEGNFNYDRPNGKWKWYYSDGKLKEEGFFNNGIRKGIWVQYTSDGKIFTKKNYDTDSSANVTTDSLKEKQN